jgi:hypothetical protein
MLIARLNKLLQQVHPFSFHPYSAWRARSFDIAVQSYPTAFWEFSSRSSSDAPTSLDQG